MKKRDLKRSIIRMIRNHEMYGYELRTLFAAHGEKVQLSYLYKTLKEMCDEGFLESRIVRGKGGPSRRQYHLSAKGKRELGSIFEEAAGLVHEFYEDYVYGLPSEFFADRFRMMMREVFADRNRVAFISSEPLTPFHHEILQHLCTRPGSHHTYLIKPPDVRTEVAFPNLTILDGTFDDIPLKDESLDGTVVVDIQDAVRTHACCKEFRRILKRGGVMFACAPFMGLGGKNEPLEVGEFMKSMKYEMTGRPYLDRETIKKGLAEKFDYVDVANMCFLTAFLAGLNPIRI